MKQIYSITRLVYVAIMCAFIASGCNQEIENGNGSIYGKILDAVSKEPVENCEIILAPGNSILKSDESGSFKFSDIPSGEYSVIFNHRDYHTQIVTAKVITRLVTMLNIELESKTPYSISCDELNFGEIDTKAEFTLKNYTSSNCSFSITNNPSWLTLSPSSGKIPSGGKQTITATINRTNLNIGEYRATLNISFAGTTKENSLLNVVALKVNVSTPSVTCSSSITNLKESSVTLSGTIKSTGGVAITQYGHCWSTSPTPTIADSNTKLGESTSTKDFTSNITGLLPLTKYYVRAYATNSQGTSYSSEIISFTTPDVYSDVWDGEIAKSFAGGSGTVIDPYIIKTGGQLQLIKQYSTSHFVIANNIDLNNHNWMPLTLTGKIDGKGYIISNLRIERSENYLGLFAYLGRNQGDDSYGEVKNITIKGVYINAPTSSFVGGLVGRVGAADNKYPVQNCKVILTENSLIKGSQYVGGIVGCNATFSNVANVEIIGCTVESTSDDYLIAGNKYVGGIAGMGTPHSCHAKVNILGGTHVGGICGSNNFSIKQCSYEGKIYANKYIGGICGIDESGRNYITGINISSSKAIVDIITNEGYAGGIVGNINNLSCNIIACYADGKIEGSSVVQTLPNVGGIYSYDTYNYANSIKHSYSTVTSTLTTFDGLGGNQSRNDNYTTQKTSTTSQGCCLDITKSMKECYSEYASYWNFDNTWTWKGTVNGQEVSVSCPRLAWE